MTSTPTEPDWPAEQLLEKGYLVGVRFQWKRHTSCEIWDHDHCEGCLTTFSEHFEEGPGSDPILREGFTTCSDYVHGSDYAWVCPDCWETFKDAMKWVLVPTEPAAAPA
ncbi:hypothetical protein [Caulobacter segnis]